MDSVVSHYPTAIYIYLGGHYSTSSCNCGCSTVRRLFICFIVYCTLSLTCCWICSSVRVFCRIHLLWLCSVRVFMR